MTLTPQERSLLARQAALIRWSKEDPRPQGYLGQAGLVRRFERQVDPDGVLPAAERQRRADAARRAHMAALTRKSKQARAARKAASGT